MPASRVDIAVTLVLETCINCDVVFGLESTYLERRQKDHRIFYCPNGHGQRYPTESSEEKLKREKRELEAQLQREREARDREVGELRNQMQRTEKRIHAGVCPHCRRTFSQLARHMKSKHKEVLEG